jgi:histidinol-phosphate/aromatic aminotransferase/cobyric acid decarboxylase-like protein
MRVTIGKQSEMETFLSAFRETLSASLSRTGANL